MATRQYGQNPDLSTLDTSNQDQVNEAIRDQVIANAERAGDTITHGQDAYGNNAGTSIIPNANAPVTHSQATAGANELFMGVGSDGAGIYRNTRTGAITRRAGTGKLVGGGSSGSGGGTGVGSSSGGGSATIGGGGGGVSVGTSASGGGSAAMPGMAGGTTTPPVSDAGFGQAGAAISGLASMDEGIPDTEVIKSVGALSSLRSQIGQRILPDLTPQLRPRLY